MLLTLKISAGSRPGEVGRQVFTEDGGTIGRNATNSWVLTHKRVSAHHATISFRNGAFYIQDMSRNGVSINSRENRLVRERPYALKSGDVIFIEPYEIDVSVDVGVQQPRDYPLKDPFGQDDPFAPVRGPQPERVNPVTPPTAGDEVDPLKYFDPITPTAPRRPAAQPPVDDWLEEHYRPPVSIPDPLLVPEPPPASAKEESVIPTDYDPLDPDSGIGSIRHDLSPPISDRPRRPKLSDGVTSTPPRPVTPPRPPASNAEDLAGSLTPSEVPAPGAPACSEPPDDTVAPRPRSPNTARPTQPPGPDTVKCSLFAPEVVGRGDTILVEVFAHLPADDEKVKLLAGGYDNPTKLRASKLLAGEVDRGARLEFSFLMMEALVDEPTQGLVWRGLPDLVQFVVQIPDTHPIGRSVGRVIVSQDTVPLGHLKFIIDVRAAAADSEWRLPSPPATYSWSSYRRAFISYASADRTEVLKRVQMLDRISVDFFHDLLSLDPGERWERALYRKIDESDVLFLFWSTAAKQSEWVMREVRYAIARQGGDEFAPPEIVPIIIEGPPPAEPPAELRHLHFNDKFMYFIADHHRSQGV